MLAVEHTEMMQHRQITWLIALTLVLAFFLALVAGHWGADGIHEAAQQIPYVVAPSLEVRGDGSIVAEVPQVCRRFVVWYGANPPPKEDMWLAMDTDARGDRVLHTPEAEVAYFQTLPRERRSTGIFITQDYTHLRHPDLLPPWVSEHMLRLMADAPWMEARRRQVQALAAACRAAGIPLWVNTDLGGGGHGGRSVRFERL